MADLTEFQKLQSIVEKDPTLKERLMSVVTRAEGSENNRRDNLSKFAQEVSEMGYPIDPSKVVESYTQTAQFPEQNLEQSRPGQRQPQGSSFLKGFSDQHDRPPQRGSDVATPALQSVQKKQFMDEFEKALAIPNEKERADAIEALTSRMDAASLLGGQVDLVKTHLFDTEIMQKRIADAVKKAQEEGKSPEQIEQIKNGILLKMENRLNASKQSVLANLLKERSTQRGKRELEEWAIKDTALKDTLTRTTGAQLNGGAAKDAFSKLIEHRMGTLNGQSLFTEWLGVWGDEDILVMELGGILQKALLAAQQQGQEEQEEKHLDKEGLSPQQTQTAIAEQKANAATQAFNAARGASSGNGGVRGRLVDQLKKQAFKQIKKYAAKFILSQPEILIPILVALLILFLVLLLIIIIVAIIINITGGMKSSSGENGTPQNVAALVSVAQEVETCERWRYGFHAPSPSCLIGLNLPATFGPEIKGFVNDVNRGYANYQCGQYIWSAQRYVLNWPLFPGNVGVVYDWYTIHASHTLQGYVWIPNPDNPAWGNSSSPANIMPGDILLYGPVNGSDPGHVAIVTTVQSDSFNIVVTEANYYHGAIDIRPTNLHDGLGRGAYILGWWRRQ